MPDIDTLNAIASIASSIGTVGVLIWWIILEKRRSDALFELLVTDWKRQREEEIEKRAEEKFQRKMMTIPTNSGV